MGSADFVNMARRTNQMLLLCFIATLCFSGAIHGAEHEVQDFDFPDSEHEVKLVKRAAVVDTGATDDEDFLADEPGSGPDDSDYEGSGTPEPVTSRPRVDIPIYYRVSIRFTSINYIPAYGDRNSREFQDLANRLQRHLQELFRRVPGTQTPTVLTIQPSGSVLVTFDLGSEGPVTEEELERILEQAVSSGIIGNYAVDAEGFSFTPLKTECPNSVGRAPDYLPRNGSNEARLMINNAFPCNGSVVGWEYYRLISQGTAYVGVWRQRGDSEFVLVRKTELPSAPTGFATVSTEFPIPVQRGDFIGIFYPRETANNVIAQATLADDVLRSDEMYQTYVGPIYNEDVEEAIPFDFTDYDFKSENSTFAIRALLEYPEIDVVSTTCLADEFHCGDGYCVLRDYVCDGQIDCHNGYDEANCPTDRSEEPCLEGRFRCANGVCINRILKCDGKPDCQDGSDEYQCGPGCGPTEFQCGSGECVPDYVQCNGQMDCRDFSDEENCPTIPVCRPDQFRCNDGTCIQASLQCNTQPDCPDSSDEYRCEYPVCEDGEFRCGENGPCIPESRVCDGLLDCAGGEDEQQPFCGTAPPTCPEGTFTCDFGTCIENSRKCDGNYDCIDSTDEIDCGPRPCGRGEFQCGDRSCISEELQCNGFYDCEDRADEEGCELVITGPEERTFEGTRIRLTCRSSGGRGIPSYMEWFKDGTNISAISDAGTYAVRNSPRPDQFYYESQLYILSSTTEDSGVYTCRLSGQRATTYTVTVYREERCRRNEFECRDGTCINQVYRCDRDPQCPDSSDEFECDCTRNEFRCDNGQCIPNGDRCNREFNCVDRSDESNCEPIGCREDEFTCDSGECIDIRRECDNTRDCRDGSDEDPSICFPVCDFNQFTCSDGSCIDARRECDGYNDCGDRSDEVDCQPQSCRADEFTCISGGCIDARLRCDRNPDCRDGSDESDCGPLPCTSNEFTCSNGECIDARFRCDRRPNCRDGSDEVGCAPASCREDQFTCRNGDCIDRASRCDGRQDCRDRSDEDGCPTCSPEEFTCASNGACITLGQRCDRNRDCSDGSDESDCPCQEGEFTCVSDGRCLPPGYKCNGRPECRDGSDEVGCVVACREGEFTCVSDGRCLPPGYQCNGRPECQDGSDEVGCVAECTEQEFRCSNNQCIPRQYQCDGQNDCSDGSDEIRCTSDVTIQVSPREMIKRVGTSASFICMVSGDPSIRIDWIRRTGGAMPPQATQSTNRLTITNLRPEDAGDYICRATSSTGRVYEAQARLGVDYVGPSVTPEPGGGPCGRDSSTCSNGQCIPRDYVCDGENDCTDGSDERECTFQLPCEPNEFRCANGRCAMKIWRCDGDNDCLDNSDEANCPSRIPGAPCMTDEFQCRSPSNPFQCIPFSYHCDGENDCQDRSDEQGCTQPSIKTPPVPEITVEINGTFTIICEAVGVPTPLIVWRLNWGNIPSGDRVTVTSVDGRGVLTIRNAIPEDAGAYTCEAINNRGSIFAIPDALIIVRRTVGVCQPPQFNAEAAFPNQCVRCFCYGHTQTCYSSNLQLSEITLGNRVQLVRRDSLEPQEEGFVQYIPSSREFQVRDFNTILRTGSYYWSLPYQYLSKRLSSYGGELSYQVYYDVEGFENPTNDPDIILSGNGITLIHRSDKTFNPRLPTTVKVPLTERSWERTDDFRPGGPISQYATREDLMMVLENVTSILIRATYDNRQSLIRLGNVLLSTGVIQNTGRGRAVYVEECTCPTGYTGYSCEECAPGFYQVDRGQFGRSCIACNCNGHSNECDPLTGICRNCRDNTAGPYCNECGDGYVGDPRTGRSDACQPCPCPLTIPSNQFTQRCVIDLDREITCAMCPTGYTGRRCEQCADGYIGNPMTPGDRCRPKDDVSNLCDLRGSISNLPDVTTGRCECKANADGQFCNRCKPDTFYLSNDYPYGCISCFCMGVTQTCQSTTWNRAQVSLGFSQSREDVYLTDMMQRIQIDQGLTVDRANRELIYTGFNNNNFDRRRGNLFWNLPQQFLGDKVTSYGGNLRFALRYRAGFDNSPISLSDPMVEIGGNDITLIYRPQSQPIEGRQQSFAVPLIETEWVRMDGERATREHLLMALADLDFILIRATYTIDTEETAISNINLDIAEDRVTGQERAYPVEQCACPLGYKGLSCEDCDSGYTRSGGGLYLGLCEPCRCNGHSTDCDPETGVCRNCRYNTEGDHCERCARGYYGDATRGSTNDCQKCPCPLTESPNQFSPDCILDTDNQVTCSACPPGYEGRRCERCANNYEGNPLQPGDYCKLRNITCDCDDRGTTPNTYCDPNTRLCQCKNNVIGRRCQTCKDGYFYLDRDNDEGCLRCHCMGVTNQCSSSNYYRSEIIPMINSDGSHNFVLTTRRLEREISDGFTVSADGTEITFNNLEEIQTPRETLHFSLPPKFRGNKVSAYGGILQYEISIDAYLNRGNFFNGVDVEIIGRQNYNNRRVRMYYVGPNMSDIGVGRFTRIEVRLVEGNFLDANDFTKPSREAFLTALVDIEAILIRATYHDDMRSVTLRDLSMEIAVPSPTGMRGAPEVESCICPMGYTGLSCEECAPGYLRVDDGTAFGRCTRCNCNGHSSSCDPVTGTCMNCQHNTEGDRCERCARGYYGDPRAGTPNDCRQCACPLTIPSNNFSPTCYLAQDNQVTCDRCPQGYTGRQCGECATGYSGNPRERGGRCERIQDVSLPEVTVNPTDVTEPLGATAVFQCIPRGQGPFNVVWSRLDGRPFTRRIIVGPGPNYLLTITDLQYNDEGRYKCSVTNSVGSSVGYTMLKIQSPSVPIRVQVQQPKRVTKEEGELVQFTCTAVQSSAANYVISWSKDNGPLPPNAFDQDGVLIIMNATMDDSGSYTCTGSDPISEHMDMAFVEIVQRQRLTVTISPIYVQVDEGERAEFRCIAEGNPPPIIEWSRGRDKPLPENSYTDSSGLFVVNSARYEDMDEYFCTATNSQGTSKIRTILYVKNIPEPRANIVVRNTDITAEIGTSETLFCYAEGTDNAILTWSREGGLPPGSYQDNGLLNLTNIQQSYGGRYICTGQTPSGSIIGRATTTVTVTGTRFTAPTARIEPSNVDVGAGMTVTLTCIVTGEPQPAITWNFGNFDLPPNVIASGNMLRIQQTTMENTGYYTCTVTNRMGRQRADVYVRVEERSPPQVQIYPDVQVTANPGSSTSFYCNVIGGNPTPTVTWTRAGPRRFTGRTVSYPNGTLSFTDLTVGESGEYMCSATNVAGTVTATTSLRVTGPPTVDVTPEGQIVTIEGERVSVECVGRGDPVPNVSWRSGTRRRSDVLPEALDGLGSASLIFESIRESDEGEYICVASNVEGTTEERIDIIVEDRETGLRPGAIIQGPSRRDVIAGQSVELTCTAQGLPNARISWRRPNGLPLPPGHSVQNGRLLIPNVQPESDGEYICSVTSITGENFVTQVYIIVTVTPQVVISPSRVSVQANEPLVLSCRASGAGPMVIEWSKVRGNLSPRAVENNGVLEIRQATRADAGRYRCVVRNSAGTSEGYADVTVQTRPSVEVSPVVSEPIVGSTIDIRCSAQGDPQPTIQWTKEGGQMPLQHRTFDGVLTIYGVAPEDSGYYTCTANNQVGSASATAQVAVQGGGGVIDRGPTVNRVRVGEMVELECIASAPGSPQVKWTRADQGLPTQALISQNVLIINNVQLEDAGIYRCTVMAPSGTVTTQVRLVVEEGPSISVQQDYRTAALGTPVELGCDASGSPQPRIYWTKEEGDMPSEYYIEDGSLVIPRVTEEDGGTYNCLAQNEYGTNSHPVLLVVGALVPYFPQNPNSYMVFDPLNDVYLYTDILLSFRPESTDGLIMYNGQYADRSGDFLCFGMQGQYPEFRFELGAGPAVIRGNERLELNKWHTVQLKRNKTEGTLIVNDQPPVTGIAPGQFQGLDIAQPMYVGSVPDFSAIPSYAGYRSGFVGGVSQIKIKGVDMNIGAEYREMVNVDSYQVCADRPCRNNGLCRPANNRFGFICECPRGFVGERCEEPGRRCYQGACGQGRCYNLPSGNGFHCICQMGFTGEGCVNRIQVVDPAFNKTSFISYPKIQDGLLSVNIRLLFKPQSLDDGIILYNAQRQDGQQDFVAIVLKDRYVEFRFDNGDGTAIIRSRNPLFIDDWTIVVAERNGYSGMLTINNEEPVNEQVMPGDGVLFPRLDRGDVIRGSLTGGERVGLNLERPLYLGGVDPAETISPNTGTYEGFVGCIGELVIKSEQVQLIDDAIESMNIRDCGDRRLCERRLCQNGAQCEDVSPTEYFCICTADFTGRNCETELNVCVIDEPCLNGGVCSAVATPQGFTCDCPLGWMGAQCEEIIRIGTEAQFPGSGYAEFAKRTFPHPRSYEEVIRMTISTTERNGLIFWQGAVPGKQEGKDFLALSVKDGYLEFSYELGSGTATIRSSMPVDDGFPHSVVARRLGADGKLQVDDGPIISGQSGGRLKVLNIGGNVFLGGVPDFNEHTANIFSTNFVGCINNVQFMDRDVINYDSDSIGGYNVLPCIANRR